jgi:hypothetical protein
MVEKKFRYKVRFTESERGWGQDSWWAYYDTPEAAQKAIDDCNKRNADDYAKTKCVPDYYVQCEDEIIAEEIK